MSKEEIKSDIDRLKKERDNFIKNHKNKPWFSKWITELRYLVTGDPVDVYNEQIEILEQQLEQEG